MTRRRDFIKLGGLAGLALPFAGIRVASGLGGLKPSGQSLNIVVLGGGLAGLSAAFELQNAGHHVTIIEARKFPGGRVRTIRGFFSEGLYAEAGALSFSPAHEFTWGYANQFGLPLRPSFKFGLNEIGSINGSVFTIDQSGQGSIPLHLTASERQAGVYGIIPLYLGQYMSNLGNPRKPGWPPADLAPLDQLSCRQLLVSLGASEGALALIEASQLGLLGFGLDSISALDAVFTESIASGAPFYEIIGGNDQLPAAFRSRFKGKFIKRAIVQAISQTSTSVAVTYLRGGQQQTITADRAVCALPFSVMGDIQVDPPFSTAKQQAISGLLLTPVTRTYLQFGSRLWEQKGYDGYGITDLEIQNTYSPTLNQAGTAGILTSYTGGQNALDLGSMSESGRESLVLGKMDSLFNGLSGLFNFGTTQIWQADPYARGAYTYFQPGQMTTLLPAAQQTEGLIHFAGEHTSAWHGWMNGALESGNRVAQEINQAAAQQSITLSGL